MIEVKCCDGAAAMQLTALLDKEHPTHTTFWTGGSKPIVKTTAPRESALTLARMIGAIR